MNGPAQGPLGGARRFVRLWRLWRHERTDPAPFYRELAAVAVAALERRNGPLAGQTVVDLGCGPGFYTEALRIAGARVIPVDNDQAELELAGEPPAEAMLADAGDLPLAAECADGVLCSNMLEHVPDPHAVLREVERILRPDGWAFVSFTNWYSPWGGHDMSPYNLLGPRVGPRLYERRHGPPRKNRFGEGLFALHIGPTLRYLDGRARLEIEGVEPRYWPRLRVIVEIPLLREVLTWNCVIHLRRR